MYQARPMQSSPMVVHVTEVIVWSCLCFTCVLFSPHTELRMEVVTILQRRKIVHESLEPDEAVVGTYQKKTFVTNFVYFEDDHWDVPEREIDEMVKTRDHQGTDKGLLVTNMETLPSNLLEKLEKQHCHFIGVGRIRQLNEEALNMRKFDLCFIIIVV